MEAECPYCKAVAAPEDCVEIVAPNDLIYRCPSCRVVFEVAEGEVVS